MRTLAGPARSGERSSQSLELILSVARSGLVELSDSLDSLSVLATGLELADLCASDSRSIICILARWSSIQLLR